MQTSRSFAQQDVRTDTDLDILSLAATTHQNLTKMIPINHTCERYCLILDKLKTEAQKQPPSHYQSSGIIQPQSDESPGQVADTLNEILWEEFAFPALFTDDEMGSTFFSWRE